jgi:molybdate transport system ATP-binding protein
MAAELEASFQHAFPGGPRICGELAMPLGEFSMTVLLGPSGSGKSSLLRVLAGLLRPDQGRIRFGAVPWFDQERRLFVPAWARPIGYVAQGDTLFPHLTVAGNLGYGLATLARPERRARVGDLLDRLGLQGLAERRPDQLSGGQQRRVALARALAPRPALLLLDEPFTGLDPDGQDGLRRELRQLLAQLGTPAVLVSHDRNDALRLGDRLVLMEAGQVCQTGPVQELFDHPGSPAAARILGVDTVHLGQVLDRNDGLVTLDLGGARLLAPDPGGLGASAYVCIRGEDVLLEIGSAASTARNRLPGTITALQAGDPGLRLPPGRPDHPPGLPGVGLDPGQPGHGPGEGFGPAPHSEELNRERPAAGRHPNRVRSPHAQIPRAHPLPGPDGRGRHPRKGPHVLLRFVPAIFGWQALAPIGVQGPGGAGGERGQ